MNESNDRSGDIRQIHRSRKFLFDRGRKERSHGNAIQIQGSI